MRRLATLALVMLATGCGYSARGSLPEDIKTVGVTTLVNQSPEPAIESLLTRAIVEAFASNGRLRVVQPERADAVLEGAVVGYEVQALAFDARANVSRYRLVVTLNLRFRDARRNTVLFEESRLQERADFRVAGAGSQTISHEEAALRTAAVDIARAIVNLAVERF